jgi:hypothetical protein
MEKTTVLIHSQDLCEDKLKQICSIYEEIDKIYQFLSKRIATPTASVYQQSMARLTHLYHDAAITDKEIKQLLETTDQSRTTFAQLLKKRREVLTGLLNTNKKLSTNVENVTTYLKHEIRNMTKNRSAISGYKPVKNEKRRSLINNTF